MEYQAVSDAARRVVADPSIKSKMALTQALQSYALSFHAFSAREQTSMLNIVRHAAMTLNVLLMAWRRCRDTVRDCARANRCPEGNWELNRSFLTANDR